MDTKDRMMIKVVDELRVKHFWDCFSYKNIILKMMIDSFKLPVELDKYIFNYVGFSSFYVPDYKVDELVALRLKESSP